MKIAGPPRRRRYRSERSQFSSPIRRPSRECRIFGPRKRPSQNPMLSPMSAPITTAIAEQDALEGRRHGGAGDDDDGVAGDDEPDQHARLEHDREPGQERPQHGVDALDGVEQPCEELVHATSLERRRAPSSLGACRSRSSPCRWAAGRIRHPSSPTIAADSPHCFWLDAGPDAATGWSWIGHGRARAIDPRPRARRRARRCGSDAPAWEAGRVPRRVGRLARLRATPRRARARRSRVADAERAAGAVAARGPLRRVRPRAPPRLGGRARGRGRRASPSAVAAAAERRAGRPSAAPPTAAVAVARHAPGEYAALIERCRDAIREGDAYQLCLTTRFEVDGIRRSRRRRYARLRAATPAHHGGLVRSGEVALAQREPRALPRGRRTAIVRTRPIKGTRPRGADAAADAALADELRASEKERAENVMIVDLMRNDLSRVCEPGSVGVDGLLEVESYPAVHQLVSTVSGTLARRDRRSASCWMRPSPPAA